MKKQILCIYAATTFVSVQAIKADVLADWTFETSQPSNTGPISPEIGNGIASASGLKISSTAGDGSAHAFSSSGWDVGDYLQFSVPLDSTDDIYSDFSISYHQEGSGTGPSSFALDYSIDGDNFTEFGSDYSLGTKANSWISPSFDLSSVAELDNAQTVYFRIIDTSTTSINGGTVGSAGTDRVDDFIVTSTVTPAPAPEPSTFALAALSALTGLVVLGRKS